MSKDDSEPIGIIYKVQLRDTLQAHAFLMRKNPEALEALAGVALAHGLGKYVNFTQFSGHQKLSGAVEGQAKRLGQGGDDEN